MSTYYKEALRVFDAEYSHGEYCHEQSFLWGFQEGVEWKKKEMISNAKQWLKDNVDKYLYNTGGFEEYIPKCGGKMFNDFEKEMLEE